MTLTINADLLIPGRGQPQHDATVVIDGHSISYVGPSNDAPEGAGSEAFDVPVVMPGMWDCHSHFSGLPKPELEALATLEPHVAAVRSARDAKNLLMAGFTSVREVGGIGVYLKRAIDEGAAIGPSIYAAGAALSETGGHADVHDFPLDIMPAMSRRHGFLGICDGVDECIKAVRRNLRLDAKLIKICASGGVMSKVDDPVHQQFTDEEIKAMVEEAGRHERIVAAHCHGKPGIMAALRNGVKTIEHGTYLDEESAEAMVEADAILVPTRFVIEHLLIRGEFKLPDYAYRKGMAIADRHAESMTTAHEAGVTLATGSDIFITDGGHGLNGRELVHLTEAGLTELEAIEAATANGPMTLGPQAPHSGILEAGFDADLIAVGQNPLDDISVLADADNVTHVWKGGVLHKSPLVQ